VRFAVIALLTLANATAQVSDVQKLVEELYPNNERMKTMRVADLVRELHASTGSTIADIGCGSGQFSVVLGKVVGPSGRVFCVDVDSLKEARRNFQKNAVKNVIAVSGASDDPKLAPGSIDGVLIVNAYHEMEKSAEMLRHIHDALKPGGRLVICDNTPHRTASRPRESQTKNHVIAEATVAADLEVGGFKDRKARLRVHRQSGLRKPALADRCLTEVSLIFAMPYEMFRGPCDVSAQATSKLTERPLGAFKES